MNGYADELRSHLTPSRLSSASSSSKWDTYSQTLLDKGIVSNFGVYAVKNFRQWTGTPDFHLTSDELKAIVAGFKDNIRIRLEGIYIQGRLFTLTRMAWNHVMMVGRYSATGAGCVVYLCKTCILVATYDDGPQASVCFNAIEKLGDYLVEQGF